MPRFGNQVVLVTGGSSGIGLATAKAFLTEGAKVAISARNLPRLRAATRSLRTFGDVRPIRGDVSNAADARRFARETERMLGPIDVLVNNAGIWIEKDLEAFTETEYDRVMDINLKGVFLRSKYVLPGMVKRRRGVIVNVSSDSGFLAAPGFRRLQRVESRAPVDDEVHGTRTRAGWHPGQRDLSGGSPYPDDGGGRSPLGCPLQRLLSATLRSNPDGARRRSG